MQDLNQQPNEYVALLPAPVPASEGQLAAAQAQATNPTEEKASATAKTYAGYILAPSDAEAQRIGEQFRLLKAEIRAGLLTALDGVDTAGRQVVGAEQTLTAHLRHQLLAGRHPVILDAGCGEGLHLHFIADLLQERDLLSQCHLLGVDAAAKHIAVADDYSCAIGRPYLNFGVHDLTRPLEESLLLKRFAATTYPGNQRRLTLDFIYLHQVLLHLPDAHQLLKRFYDHLAPGGYLMLMDPVSYEGGEWGYNIAGKMTPLIEDFYRVLFEPLRANNPEGDVGKNSHKWLSEWGAEIVEYTPLRLTAGGRTEQGVGILRNFVKIIANSRDYFVNKTGRLSGDYYDALQKELFEKLSPDMVCEFTMFRTVVRKPTE